MPSSVTSVTIDRISVDAHSRYAKDKIISELYPFERPIDDFEVIGQTPIYPSLFTDLFELNRCYQPWSLYHEPFGYRKQRKRFFGYAVFPEDGLFDKEESRKQKIKMITDCDEHAEEKKTIISLFSIIFDLNDAMVEILRRRLQYHKG